MDRYAFDSRAGYKIEPQGTQPHQAGAIVTVTRRADRDPLRHALTTQERYRQRTTRKN